MKLGEIVKPYFERSLHSAESTEKAFREAAWKEYLRRGLPDRHDENWKYSSLLGLDREWSPRAPVVQSDFPLESLASVPELELTDGFTSLVAASFQQGFELNLQSQPAQPIIIRHHQEGEGAWLSSLASIRLAAGVKASVVEVFTGATGAYLRTGVTRVELSEGARLTWLRLQHESAEASHLSEVQAVLGESAVLNLTQVNGGAAWSRTNLKVDLSGVHAEAHVNGLSFGRDQQHIDQRVRVRHRAPETTSSQLFKGVLKDKSRGVLNGKIHIFPGAQKVNSSQLNHNLLLSRTAEADTKPELEIYADDVKANHGATIGRLDEEKLFYLESRGIAPAAAREMLAHAFVTEVVMKIPDSDLRESANEHIKRILPDYVRDMESE